MFDLLYVAFMSTSSLAVSIYGINDSLELLIMYNDGGICRKEIYILCRHDSINEIGVGLTVV